MLLVAYSFHKFERAARFISVVCCFNEYVRHLRVPSFPTRRSSDLRTTGFTTACWVPGTPGHSWQAVACGGTTVGRRSEEHTSALQSHSELVCRLLLAKKTYIHLHEIIYNSFQ